MKWKWKTEFSERCITEGPIPKGWKTEIPSRFKLSERAQRELDEKENVVFTDAEWKDFLSQLFIISDCNETAAPVTWQPF